MTPLEWAMAPLVITLIAWGVVAWRSRPRPPGDAIDTVSEHERFRDALAGQRRAAGRRDPR